MEIKRQNYDGKIKEAFEFLSNFNQEAYKDIFMLSNQVLSKNPHTNCFFEKFVINREIKVISFPAILCKLVKYFFYSFKDFLSYILEKTEFMLSGYYFKFKTTENELILIDSFFEIKQILLKGEYKDRYFPGLLALLNKLNKHYAYLPNFNGMKKRLTIYKVFKIIKRERLPVLSEYQLVTLGDYLRILYFIVLYPIKVIHFAYRLNKNNLKESMLKNELLNTLDQISFPAFSRYLQGKRIAGIKYKNIKVISWYENQVSHKNLYKGLRDKKRVRIYGAQLFIYPETLLNIIPDEQEVKFGIVPDKVIVNGEMFVPEKSNINYHVGPSLRYNRVFKTKVDPGLRRNILVLLPYYKEMATYILNLLKEVTGIDDPVIIKSHPALDADFIRHLIRDNATLSEIDTHELLFSASILICAATGASVEAAAMGVPVIYVKANECVDFNFLPQIGRGIIWNEVSNSYELSKQIKEFKNCLESNSNEISEMAEYYRANFFSEPNESKICESFELSN
jgi:hypothetical protein